VNDFVSSPPTSTSGSSSSLFIPILVGSLIGGLLILLISGFLIYKFCFRRKRKVHPDGNSFEEGSSQNSFQTFSSFHQENETNITEHLSDDSSHSDGIFTPIESF
jgi:hypothetical protein